MTRLVLLVFGLLFCIFGVLLFAHLLSYGYKPDWSLMTSWAIIVGAGLCVGKGAEMLRDVFKD